jgi:phosphoribosylanthranilate isomerase
VKVKICGITRAEDARAAADSGAWAIGFIFYSKSPRYVTPGAAAKIGMGLPSHLERFGVFVNERPNEIERISKEANLTRVQLHGEESPEACSSLSLPVMKVFRDVGQPQLRTYASVCTSVLLDSRAPVGVWGGTGTRADVEFAKTFRELRNSQAPDLEFFLAGGIDASNVLSAIHEVNPDGLDVSSGVEDAPGIKSAAKIRALLQAVRGAVRK